MGYFFLLGYIIIISTGWQYMRKQMEHSVFLIALCSMLNGTNLENASILTCMLQAYLPQFLAALPTGLESTFRGSSLRWERT
jgi:hypothetical protein